MSRDSRWFGDIIGIFFASIIIFLLIYFFAPEVSSKFFGFSFSERSMVSEAIVEFLDENNVETAELQEFFKTPEGKQVLDEILKLSKEGGTAIAEKLNSPEVQSALDNAKEYADSGLGSMSDYLKDTFLPEETE